jgi:phage tail sheath protein FI
MDSMPVRPTYPGVYIEEVPSGVRTIAGVSTSTTLFIGRTAQGPVDVPTRVLGVAEFERVFGLDSRFGELPQAVQMFFGNGGGEAWIVRIAKDAAAATVTLKSEARQEVLKLTARNKGKLGDLIRASVSYAGPNPEGAFSLEMFRWEKLSNGQLVRRQGEVWSNLTMNPSAGRNALSVINSGSRLVEASAGSTTAAAATGYSQAGYALASDTPAAFRTDWNAATASGLSKFEIDVDGTGRVPVDVTSAGQPAASATGMANFATALASAINTAIAPRATVTVAFVPGPGGAGANVQLRISSATGDVLVYPSADATKDLASKLLLGTSQGGIEVSKWANLRPAPTGTVFKALPDQVDAADLKPLMDLANLERDKLTVLRIGGPGLPTKQSAIPDSTAATKIFVDPDGKRDGVRRHLANIATAINTEAGKDPNFPIRAEVWGHRLALLPIDPLPDTFAASSVATEPVANDIGASFASNVRSYSLGANGAGAFQTPGAPGDDGSAPELKQYTDAFQVVDKTVDIFNLLVLPRDASGFDRQVLWGAASVFCQKRRAFLLVDPPEGWSSRDDAVSPATGVNRVRQGLVKDHAALFFPKVLFNDNGVQRPVSPSGAIAGLMARTDAARGVWKAPAGQEATLTGILGLAQSFSNDENGVMNPRAVNTLRVFPTGLVNWGARTLDGDDDFGSEWKYIPVRRLALYIEESLYRGTQWVVFEPNDEPLWSQIRLNLGSFMHSLFRQGAFAGKSPRDAYFVKCDRETTTQDDINRGMVNVLVGFAPLKPAEFVIIRLQQMAGQLAT